MAVPIPKTKKRRERTVFDGIEPNDRLSPREVNICPALIRAWEKDLARLNQQIEKLMDARAAHLRNLTEAKQFLADIK